EYLQLENQILCEKQGGNRVLLNDDQRRRLAVKGKALGRQQLKKITAVALPPSGHPWRSFAVALPRHEPLERHHVAGSPHRAADSPILAVH
ncbi:MAG: hypothetical protein IH991_00290, partial [Planctomycetes bacterium]|nr:hypothetical protein [Planctomycetota bacterium]